LSGFLVGPSFRLAPLQLPNQLWEVFRSKPC
jgi:hypothetical protein